MKKIMNLICCLVLLACAGDEQQIKQEYQQIAKIMEVMDFGEDMPDTPASLTVVEHELDALDLSTKEMQKFREKLKFRFYYQRKVIEMDELMKKSNMSVEEDEIHEEMMTYITSITPQLADVMILEDKMADKYAVGQ